MKRIDIFRRFIEKLFILFIFFITVPVPVFGDGSGNCEKITFESNPMTDEFIAKFNVFSEGPIIEEKKIIIYESITSSTIYRSFEDAEKDLKCVLKKISELIKDAEDRRQDTPVGYPSISIDDVVRYYQGPDGKVYSSPQISDHYLAVYRANGLDESVPIKTKIAEIVGNYTNNPNGPEFRWGILVEYQVKVRDTFAIFLRWQDSDEFIPAEGWRKK